MARHLIHRTGLQRGRVYDNLGANITEDPEGAGNDEVGSWSRDYSGLTGNSNLYGGEFSGIIADGRAMQQNAYADEDMLFPDFDQDEQIDTGTSFIDNTRSGGVIHELNIRLALGVPSYFDAGVFSVDPTDGTIEFIEELSTWLDNANSNPLIEPADTFVNNPWWTLRHFLRVPLHFAVYVVPASTPPWEGHADMLENNGMGVLQGQAPQLTHGPWGMLAQMHGSAFADDNYVRLWEPCDGIRFLHRRDVDMHYGSTMEGDDFSVGDTVDPDVIGTDVDADEVGAPAQQEMLDSPAQRARGQNFWLRLKTRARYRCKPDEVLVWHLQTGWARLEKVSGGGPGHLIIAGTSSPPRSGPFLTLHYHECVVRGRTW